MTIIFPEQESFEIIVVKPYDITPIKYDDPNYKEILCNLKIYETKKCNSSNFFDDLVDLLEIEKFKKVSLNTQLIYTDESYHYEMIHIDLMPDDLPVEIYNGIANLLKTDYQHIFGNCVLMKTLVPKDSDIVKVVNFSLNDLNYILGNMVNHIGVKIDDDGEIEEFSWYYEPDKVKEDFFIEEPIFKELAFLGHNLQIYYTKGNRNDMSRLIEDNYCQMMILTKLEDNKYGNIKLWEVNDIISLLNSECPIDTPEEWKKINENENKKNFFNKYKALYRAKKEFLN